jgi:hypothetical protein
LLVLSPTTLRYVITLLYSKWQCLDYKNERIKKLLVTTPTTAQKMSFRVQRGNLVANACTPCIATRLPRRPKCFAHAAPRNDMVFILSTPTTAQQ